MAQTRKRRRTKHRGNAAGMVEARGRTGRKPTPAEQKQARLDRKEEARRRRLERLDTPPTWRGALNRAAIAAAFFLVLMLVIQQPIAGAVSLAAIMLLIYIPMSYYTDLFIYRRRQRQKAAGKLKS